MKKVFVLILLAVLLVVGAAGTLVYFYLQRDYVIFVE